MGRPVTNEQISDAIKKSGMNQQQLRDRLKTGGYDASLADPFFGNAAGAQALPGAAAAQSGRSAEFANALEALGFIPEPVDEKGDKRLQSAVREVSRYGGVFGKDIFDRASTAFDPITSGPVDAAYRLGVGDALQLIVTGQVELAYPLEVRRDGTVIIPQVGQVSLAGLTLDAARGLLKSRMSASYSGLTNGEARLDLSIARLRSNAVFVIGEVESPGAIQVNALATVFSAIARAGGPTVRGSFREIEVRRGNKVIERLDLYDYLLRGDAAGDIRLEQGDVIYVPLNDRVVAVVGAVRRPRIFELRASEGFGDLLRFAGGLLPSASVDRVQIDRILPPEKRTPGFDRVKIDVGLKVGADSLARVKLLDGDIVSAFNVGDLRRNLVSISGQVFQPGEYEFREQMTLGGLIAQAQGMLPDALPDRVKVVRFIPLTGRSELYSLDAKAPAGSTFVLQEFDQIEVLNNRADYPGGQVTIEGAVESPAVRPYVERESLRDAIERSGGLREEAQSIEVSRRRTGAAYSDTTSIRFLFPVTVMFRRDSSIASFVLERDDHIFVRTSPGFRAQQFVRVSGQFKSTGVYGVTENRDRVRDLVLRAGDVLPGAYPESFHLIRQGKLVSVDFAKAMRGDPDQNLPLLGGDALIIDRDPMTVLVTGAVSRASLIRFRQGLSVSDYIELAGGPTEKAQTGKAVVDYPSGFSKRVKRVGLFFHSSPDVVSGATITVPEKPEQQGNVTETLTRVLSITTAFASLVLAFVAIRR